jgi:hypothetical protein
MISLVRQRRDFRLTTHGLPVLGRDAGGGMIDNAVLYTAGLRKPVVTAIRRITE